MDSVWQVVDAVNNYSKFAIAYPSSVEEQKKIAAGFQKASTVGFDICAGAIDGILIWTRLVLILAGPFFYVLLHLKTLLVSNCFCLKY